MTKSTIIFTGIIFAAAVMASLRIQCRTEDKLHENESLLRQRVNQLAELAAEKQRLSNLVVQTRTNSATIPDNRTAELAELAQLRAKVEALREQVVGQFDFLFLCWLDCGIVGHGQKDQETSKAQGQ